MLKLALSQLRDQPRRYVSVLLAIVIGVTFLASALLVGSSSTASLRNSLGATYSQSDLVVASEQGDSDPFTTMTALAEQAGTPAEPGPLNDVEGVAEAYAHTRQMVGVQRPADAQGQGTWGRDTDFAMVSALPADTSLLAEPLVDGEYPATGSPDGITLDARTAEDFGLEVGSTTLLRADSGEESPGRTVTVTGITEVSQDPNSIGAIQVTADEALRDLLVQDAVDGMVAGMTGALPEAAPDAAAAAAAEEEARASAEESTAPYAEHVLIRLEPGADPAAVQAALDEHLAEEGLTATAATPDEQAQEQVAVMAGSNIFVYVLAAFAVIALFVTALVISNTFSVLVAQRSRDLALQRALGATRRQVRGSVLTEAAVIGVIGSVIGVGVAAAVVAVLVAWGATQEGFGFLTFEAAPIQLAACIAVGMALTVVASMGAALAATRVSPLEAMRPREDAAVGNRAGVVRLVSGSVLLLAGLAGLVWGAWQANLAIAVAGGALSFAGVLLLAVLFVPAAVAGIGHVARPAGVPGRMARLNALRNPGRSAATASALLIGTTLVAMMLTGGRTAQHQMDTIFSTEFPVDLQIELAAAPGAGQDPLAEAGGTDDAGPAADPGTSGAAGETGAAVDAAAAHSAVAGVDGVDAAALLQPVGTLDGGTGAAAGSGRAGDGQVAYAASPEDLKQVVSALPTGDNAERLGEPGTILVPNTVEAEEVTVTGPEGSITLDAVASASSSLAPVLTLEDAAELGLDGSAESAAALAAATGAVPTLWVAAADGVTLDGLQELNTELAQAAGVTQDRVSGELGMRLLFSVIVDGMLMVVTALLAVSVLIALIGVANTLSLSAIERSRENSLMRALGLTRRGLRGMLALEAMLISGVAALIGCVLGTFYGGMGSHTVFAEMAAGIGQTVVWPVVPWWELAVIIGVSVAAGLLASVAPSQRAARLSPVEGLAIA